MNGDVSDGAARDAGATSLALASIVVWLVAAASTGPLGIWPAIGGAAVALGVAVLRVRPPSSREALLRPSPRLVLLGAAAGGSMAAATYLLYPVLARVRAVHRDRHGAALRGVSRAVAGRRVGRARPGHPRRGAGLARRRAERARAAPRSPGAGVALAAVAYALAHAPLGSPVLVAVAFLCGLVWGTLRATTREPRAHPGGSPGVGRARAALAAAGRTLKRSSPASTSTSVSPRCPICTGVSRALPDSTRKTAQPSPWRKAAPCGTFSTSSPSQSTRRASMRNPSPSAAQSRRGSVKAAMTLTRCSSTPSADSLVNADGSTLRTRAASARSEEQDSLAILSLAATMVPCRPTALTDRSAPPASTASASTRKWSGRPSPVAPSPSQRA